MSLSDCVRQRATAHSWRPADKGVKKLMTGLARLARRVGGHARPLSGFEQQGCLWQHPSTVPTFYLCQLILGRSVRSTRTVEGLHVLNKPVACPWIGFQLLLSRWSGVLRRHSVLTWWVLKEPAPALREADSNLNFSGVLVSVDTVSSPWISSVCQEKKNGPL